MLGDGEYFSTDDLSALAPVDPGWQLILHASNQVVLYNPTSHALSIRQRSSASTPVQVIKRARDGSRCPYCHRSIPSQDGLRGQDEEELDHALYEDDLDEHPRSRAPNYFQLLQIANETASIPSTPIAETSSRDDTPPATPTTAGSTPFRAGNMADGYFKAFFQEECRLGMGANGSVYLCQVSGLARRPSPVLFISSKS
ncbi:hypothetical protein PHLCEN_2v12696 [Hermanssonia centrifuga]|uniref:Uncharacterized protein n=1 Tax=Hermanssonia centrifuga TaxID=98765 RepID=A0A2R6NGI5_9APHY|nr:hypothetical protein PHLCEN_2v12696 [Hermanssonia centrifuga]